MSTGPLDLEFVSISVDVINRYYVTSLSSFASVWTVKSIPTNNALLIHNPS